MVKAPRISISGKNAQIEKASSHVFIAVAIASVIISFSLVTLNILWGQAQFNMRVQDQKEEARDILLSNIDRSEGLLQNFKTFEGAGDLITEQGDKRNSVVVLDALPSRYDFPAVASAIQNLATTSRVTLSGFDGTDEEASAQQVSPRPQPAQIEFSGSVEGTYSNIKRFIANVERSVRPIVITNMTLSGTDANLQLSFNAYTYYQPGIDLSITTKEIQ